MKKITIFCIIALSLAIISCSKDENQTGYADKVVGTYNGTTSSGTAHLSCISEISKTSNTKVKLTIIISGSSFVFGEIDVMNGAGNTYILNYTDQSGYIDGKVEGNVLTYSVNKGVLNSVFTGTR